MKTKKPEIYRGKRCHRCGWALYDGAFCQCPHCPESGNENVKFIRLSSSEWTGWITKEKIRVEDEREELLEILRMSKKVSDMTSNLGSQVLAEKPIVELEAIMRESGKMLAQFNGMRDALLSKATGGSEG